MSKARCILIFIVLKAGLSHAQFADSLRIVAGTAAILATNDHQPLWLVSNRFGSIADRKNDLIGHIRIGNRHVLINGNKSDNTSPNQNPKEIYIKYGADFYGNNQLKDLFFQEAFLTIGYMNWIIRAGRFKEVIGEMDPDLSSGSLGISGNSLPIPKIQIALSDFTDLPFANGWVQVKGQFSHGWMGINRYMKDAFLHEKNFYMRLGKRKLKLFGGIQHYAEWGGRRDDWLHLDRSWNGFIDVLLAREADDGSYMDGKVKDGSINQDSLVYGPNRAGDHRGVIEGGMEWGNGQLQIRLYHQTPFDMGNGIRFKNIDKLLGISLKNIRLDNFLQKVVFEFIYTKQMNDFDPSFIRESYYNNGVYKTGWEYEDRIIGTPLFINRIRGSHYFSSVEPYNWNAPKNEIDANSNIINNRIIGGHLGFSLMPVRGIQTKTMITITRNYGTHTPHGPFVPPLNQIYTLQEIRYQSSIPHLKYTLALGIDHGELTKNVGLMAGIEWIVFGNTTDSKNNHNH
jgi:hypothetical protein